MVKFLNYVDLDSVTTATTGKGVNVSEYERKSVFVNVSTNTGAVTVSIEASHDGTTWFNLDTKTYTAVTGRDIFSYSSFFKYMRTKTTTQSSSTVTTTFTGRE